MTGASEPPLVNNALAAGYN